MLKTLIVLNSLGAGKAELFSIWHLGLLPLLQIEIVILSNIGTCSSVLIDWFYQTVLTNIIQTLKLRKVIWSRSLEPSSVLFRIWIHLYITRRPILSTAFENIFSDFMSNPKTLLSWNFPSITSVVFYNLREAQTPCRKGNYCSFKVKSDLVFYWVPRLNVLKSQALLNRK